MIRVEHRAAGCAWVIVDRREARNALTFAMWERLREVAVELDADTAVRAVVITGADTKAFVAGTDIAEFRAFEHADDGIAYEKRIDAVITALESIRVPTIAAVAGACTGGGVSIAAACDVRIAAPNARVGIPIARTLGNCISVANVARLASVIGLEATKRVIFSAALLDADAARQAGFFTDVVPSENELAEAAETAAQRLAELAPLTLRATKEMCRRLRAAQALPPDADLIELCYGSADFREGRAAFLGKRPAKFTGS